MASIRNRNGKLFIDFKYLGKRCRETTMFEDTKANRKQLQIVVDKMQAEITLGTFNYKAYFPKSKKADEMMALKDRVNVVQSDTALFKDFANLWYEEKSIEWRYSYQKKNRGILDNYLIPHFGKKPIHLITREDLLAYRTQLAKVKYGSANKSLSNNTINIIMLRMKIILQEASFRYSFKTPYQEIKNLKEAKHDVEPFSLPEVWLFINNVRADYKNYYTVRFFTGMRTGEIDGLKWKYIDFERREIKIRESRVRDRTEKTKTKKSNREIAMNDAVYEALKKQYEVTHDKSDYVFCNAKGKPLRYRTVNKSVWHPTLKHLGLKRRTAYQTRHTCATLWLSSGENPEWIAKQMGHSSTEMLFTVYSRFIPNATRRDGSAFENLLRQSKHLEASKQLLSA